MHSDGFFWFSLTIRLVNIKVEVVGFDQINRDYKTLNAFEVTVFSSKANAVDIESLSVPAHLQKRAEPLDKLRGFVKYSRQKKIYRSPEERLNDWDEVNKYATWL